jgi:hypothetical protein
MADLEQRTASLACWIAEGPPLVFNLGTFFFPQAFLVAPKQNFARKHQVPIDAVVPDFAVLRDACVVDQRPEDGVYVTGMFIEGARWNASSCALDESLPKVCCCLTPVSLLLSLRWNASTGALDESLHNYKALMQPLNLFLIPVIHAMPGPRRVCTRRGGMHFLNCKE